MAYGTGGTTTGYNTHVVGTGGYCKVTQESETPITGRIKWKQPILTANTGNPEMWIQNVSDEKQGAGYRAFDGQDTTWCTDNYKTSASLLLRIKQPIYIKSISVQAFKNEWGETKTVQLYKDSTTTSANNLGSKTFNHDVSDAQVWEFSEPIYTDTILVMVTGQNWCAIKEITIDAEVDIGTQIKEINEFKLVNIPDKKYYKYEYSDWTQPTLTANGTMGGNSFAVSADSSWSGYNPYYACDKNAGTQWISGKGASSPFIFYNPTPIIVKKLEVSSQHSDSGIQAQEGKVYGSNTNGDWVQIGTFTGGSWNKGFVCDLSSNDSPYTYYRIVPTTATSGNWGIYELTITALGRTSTNGTADDYDYYEDINNYYGII
jgi:hypothetical protein